DGTAVIPGSAPSFDAPNEGAVIGTGWNFPQVFSGGNGVIYAIDNAGNLHWYKDTHRDGTSNSFNAPNNGAVIGIGWDRFVSLTSPGNGEIYARDSSGNLFWYQDLADNGTQNFAPGSGTLVGSG